MALDIALGIIYSWLIGAGVIIGLLTLLSFGVFVYLSWPDLKSKRGQRS